MKQITLSVTIDASVKTVWENITELNKYKAWAKAFSKESYFAGSWEKGSKILFLAPNKNNKLDGTISEIYANEKFKHIGIRHHGYIDDNVQDTSSDEVMAWAPSHEDYYFEELDKKKTKFSVKLEATEDSYDDYMEIWPLALDLLKENCEKK
jgi:hypothetical protein